MKNKHVFLSPLSSCTLPLSLGLSLSLAFQATAATSIVENFESETAANSTPPSGWSVVTVAGTPTYTSTAAGLGSNGSGGNSGLAGQVTSTAFTDNNLPGGYLLNSTTFDITQAITGTFEFYLPQEGTFDDGTFSMGDIGSGFANSAGDSLTIKFIESSNNIFNTLADANNSALKTSGNVVDDNWYRVAFSWTPTSGKTGDFEATATRLSNSGVAGTFSTTDYTFNPDNVQFGFGSVNDTIRFDNINIQSVPEPSATALLGLGGLALILRRKRSKK